MTPSPFRTVSDARAHEPVLEPDRELARLRQENAALREELRSALTRIDEQSVHIADLAEQLAASSIK